MQLGEQVIEFNSVLEKLDQNFDCSVIRSFGKMTIQQYSDSLDEQLIFYLMFILHLFMLFYLSTFFNCNSITGGWNNNPTVGQFTAIFRRLLARCGVEAGSTGNVVAPDNTAFVTATSAFDFIHSTDEEVQPFIEDDLFDQRQYSFESKCLNALIENAVVYIAGWVVFKVLKALNCDVCRQSLVTTELPLHVANGYNLLVLKNKGGLCIPSEGLVRICSLAEKCIRQNCTINKAMNKTTADTLIFHVCKIIGSQDILNLGDHIYETQNGINNHHFPLIRLVLSKYFSIRLHHIANLHTVRMQGRNVRHSLTKAILFKGQ